MDIAPRSPLDRTNAEWRPDAPTDIVPAISEALADPSDTLADLNSIWIAAIFGSRYPVEIRKHRRSRRPHHAIDRGFRGMETEMQGLATGRGGRAHRPDEACLPRCLPSRARSRESTAGAALVPGLRVNRSLRRRGEAAKAIVFRLILPPLHRGAVRRLPLPPSGAGRGEAEPKDESDQDSGDQFAASGFGHQWKLVFAAIRFRFCARVRHRSARTASSSSRVSK